MCIRDRIETYLAGRPEIDRYFGGPGGGMGGGEVSSGNMQTVSYTHLTLPTSDLV